MDVQLFCCGFSLTTKPAAKQAQHVPTNCRNVRAIYLENVACCRGMARMAGDDLAASVLPINLLLALVPCIGPHTIFHNCKHQRFFMDAHAHVDDGFQASCLAHLVGQHPCQSGDKLSLHCPAHAHIVRQLWVWGHLCDDMVAVCSWAKVTSIATLRLGRPYLSDQALATAALIA